MTLEEITRIEIPTSRNNIAQNQNTLSDKSSSCNETLENDE